MKKAGFHRKLKVNHLPLAMYLSLVSILLTSCGVDIDTVGSNSLPVVAGSSEDNSGGGEQTGTAELVTLNENQVAIYYKRDDGNYTDWGLHLWNDDACNGLTESSLEGVEWTTPKLSDGVSEQYGAYFILDTVADTQCFNFIIHKGDEKALGDADSVFDLTQGAYLFAFHGNAVVSYDVGGEQPLIIGVAEAYWLSPDTIVWEQASAASQVELYYSVDASLEVDDANKAVVGGDMLALGEGAISAADAAQFPHLQNLTAFSLNASTQQIKAILKGQVVVAAKNAQGEVTSIARIQKPGVIDDLYYYDGELGLVFGEEITFKLWAPTALEVNLHVFDANKNLMTGYPKALNDDDANGVWELSADETVDRAFYQYEITVYHPSSQQIETLMVTDPYSVSLSTNSLYSQVVNLDDADLKPEDWDTHTVNKVENPEDIVIYESHVRDFSINDSSVPAEMRGKYLAFTQSESTGMQHLKELQEAGVSHFHLLPVFDIATIDEENRVEITDTVGDLCAANPNASVCGDPDVSDTVIIASLLATYEPASENAQALMDDIRWLDGFNWGYDPFHFNTPEGSYATSAEGVTRIKEFREMVKSLHDANLNVVMDVVYNHTNASGLNDKSILDKVVPGYYHRLNNQGQVETSSCCDNTASEHRMMEKFMIDSLVLWTRHYKIDSYRFDIMGHHMKSHILAAREAVLEVDSGVYIYGEGWNFGEVADGARGENAIQVNMAGTGIGTFNDRLRDAVRGGGPFDSEQGLRINQGFANGLYSQPNELVGDEASQKSLLLELSDRMRVTMAGSLRDFVITDRFDTQLRGSEVDYFGGLTGYTSDPQETINYISKHDNQTLWDNNQYKIAKSVSTDDRVRMQILGLSVPILSQGIPFLHMGSELLRSKSMQRDSYDSGDWFNRVNFTKSSNNWNVGLPREDKDGLNWPVIRDIITDPFANPSSEHIIDTYDRFLELLRVRQDTKLIRLNTQEQILSRVDFKNTGSNQTPGVIIMTIDDGLGLEDIDTKYDAVLIAVNGSNQAVTFSDANYNGLQIHPILSTSVDEQQAAVIIDGENITIPALTTTVLVKLQGVEQGTGLPAGDNIVAPFGQTKVYIRGTLNEWGAPDNNQFIYGSDGIYTAMANLEVASYEFKVADADWAQVNLGLDGGIIEPGGAALTLAGSAGNITLDVTQPGLYEFVLNAKDLSSISLSVSLQN
ncbi:MAG: pullulanase-type alpha-1,6-glucosidase [Pseudomonadota bacterium]